MADAPVKATGLFDKVMADISARAKEYRARELTGSNKRPTKIDDWPEREAAIKGCPKPKWGKTFEAFDLSVAPRMAKARDAAMGIAAGTWKPWCLVLSGGYGSGKTHLAYAAANYRREHGLPYRMITAPALMAQLKNAIDEKRRSVDTMAPLAYGPEDWVRVYGETTALFILDDFGAHQETEWATTQMFAVLNARYDRGLPTLITTNLPREQIDPRIASRIGAGLVLCHGEDQRMRFG